MYDLGNAGGRQRFSSAAAVASRIGILGTISCSATARSSADAADRRWPTYSRVEPFRRRSAGCQRIADAGKPDRLITERGKHFLVGEKPLACIVEHQHGLALPEREGRQVVVQYLLGRGDAGQPNLETAADARRAPDVHRSAMLADDLAHGREPQATTG